VRLPHLKGIAKEYISITYSKTNDVGVYIKNIKSFQSKQQRGDDHE